MNEREQAEQTIRTIIQARKDLEALADKARDQLQEHLAGYRKVYGETLLDGATKIAPGKQSAEEKASGQEGRLRVFSPVQRKG